MKKVKPPIDPAFLARHDKKDCISIIIPTHRLSPERRGDALAVKRAIDRASEQLRAELPEAAYAALNSSLAALYAQIDFEHNAAGIGLFVTAAMQQLVHFHFPVKEKIIIDYAFEIRDILYQSYYQQPYLLLAITEKNARLFRGLLDTLTEVRDTKFPLVYTEDYEYNPPSRSTSYGGHAVIQQFEKDKSRMETIRHEKFFSEADTLLDEYLQPAMPLVVAGDKKDLALFAKECRHRQLLAGTLAGNYSHRSEQELGQQAWELVRLHLDAVKQKLLTAFAEKTGSGLGINGIEAVWQAVHEGKGLQLLVEKDFALPGFVKKDAGYPLHLHRPAAGYVALPDAVNTLLLTMLEKNGEVYLCENGSLDNYNHIALITRY